MARRSRSRARGSYACGARQRFHARVERAWRPAGRAHRAPGSSPARDAVPATRVSGDAMVTAERKALARAVGESRAAQPRLSLGAIWSALADVADPEIPVVS